MRMLGFAIRAQDDNRAFDRHDGGHSAERRLALGVDGNQNQYECARLGARSDLSSEPIGHVELRNKEQSASGCSAATRVKLCAKVPDCGNRG